MHRFITRILPGLITAALVLPMTSGSGYCQGAEGYVGSWECRECHGEVYYQWSLTPHARMLRNAMKDPGAVEATDFGPQIPFQREDIYFTIGSHWIQKYMTLLGGQFYVLPKYWNIAEERWEPYSI